jgi:hypothetical protein
MPGGARPGATGITGSGRLTVWEAWLRLPPQKSRLRFPLGTLSDTNFSGLLRYDSLLDSSLLLLDSSLLLLVTAYFSATLPAGCRTDYP